MRLPARRIATTALCAGLLIGISGPAVMAADGESVRERTHAASHAPLPDVAELQSQVGSLAGLGGVLTPVTDMLTAVLKAEDGRLSAADADKLSDAVKDALAKAEAADADADDADTDDTATTPGTATPAQPPAVTAPEAGDPVTLPAPVAAQDETAAAPDLTATAYAELQKQVDALVKATTAGSAEQVSPAVENVVTGVVNVVAATLVGNGLPAADLAGLPAVPSAPEATAPQAATPASPLPANPA
ncbi:hypothetical protein LZP81_01195 [Streptomyces parvulus]|uniref:Uncharacterized protein n=1 Tax=Streptomyces parvulus TaxID=146923 RepID=A0A191UY06_9ACTN|nr:hypothetical protein [Streptomyces parvulus]ANJ07557.1 hypothetical protein Spa2297_11435 [Streptomyces parvulus]MCC9155306.1 hypothetical protein [Streptomyces parvulus]MCE7685469.1 hypothetical protein [Streptomyces parvulus]MCQ4197487.1 hypothetical protein [Streptomyces parvulus]GGR69198.1 hypothetical protein GCM10010220_21330 [Streptomyces parvulus]